MAVTFLPYDRRIGKTVHVPGQDDRREIYVYHGKNIVLEFDKDGTGDLTDANLAHRYLYGPAVDQILADEKVTDVSTAGAISWLLADNLGTIRDVAVYDAALDQTTVVNHITYDAFGKILTQTNPSYQPRFAFTGREWDADAGLYYYRARWYDPQVGRFLSKDPKGFAAGDVNLSRYVGNSPTNFIDPSGMQSIAPLWPLPQPERPDGERPKRGYCLVPQCIGSQDCCITGWFTDNPPYDINFWEIPPLDPGEPYNPIVLRGDNPPWWGDNPPALPPGLFGPPPGQTGLPFPVPIHGLPLPGGITVGGKGITIVVHAPPGFPGGPITITGQP